MKKMQYTMIIIMHEVQKTNIDINNEDLNLYMQHTMIPACNIKFSMFHACSLIYCNLKQTVACIL